MFSHVDTRPLVSVIVPSYNHGRYIQKTIESILNQSYGRENIELIVIDDCSKDNSANVIRSLSKKHGFTFHSNPRNKGVVKNLNTFLKMAHGKYIASCASDDYWHLDKLKDQVNLMESLGEDYAVCHTNAFVLNERSEEVYLHDGGKEFEGDIMPLILIKNAIVAPSTLIRKKVFTKVGYFDESMSFEDREMWIRISLGYKFAHLDKVLVYRRQHLNNLSRNMNLWYESYSQIFEKYHERFVEFNLVQDYHYTMFTHMSGSNRKLSILHLVKSRTKLIQMGSLSALLKLFMPYWALKNNLALRLKAYLHRW